CSFRLCASASASASVSCPLIKCSKGSRITQNGFSCPSLGDARGAASLCSSEFDMGETLWPLPPAEASRAGAARRSTRSGKPFLRFTRVSKTFSCSVLLPCEKCLLAEVQTLLFSGHLKRASLVVFRR